MSLLSRLFPESIFARKLAPAADRRLRLAQARAEETLIDAHVTNALMFIDALAEDLSFDRAIDSYVRVMAVPEPLASVVATRVLVALGDDLVPDRVRDDDVEPPELAPPVRLGDAGANGGDRSGA